jgi:hypothetical protein
MRNVTRQVLTGLGFAASLAAMAALAPPPQPAAKPR